MLSFVSRRLGQAAIVLLGAAIVVFALLRIIPGDPVDLIFADEGGGSEEQRQSLRRRFGLDRPLPIQFLMFCLQLLRGDLGQSFVQQASVSEIVLRALPYTIELAVASLVIAIVIAIPLGAIAGLRHGGVLDRGSTTVALFGVSMPTFWQGIMLILLFAVALPILPTSGALDVSLTGTTLTGFPILDATLHGEWDVLRSALRHIILPAITLGTTSAAGLMRLLRTSVIDVKNQEFVDALVARGLSTLRVSIHIIRNALPVTVIVLGMRIGTLLGGAVVVEVVFGWPGIGGTMIRAIELRDFPVVQGTVLLATLMVIVSNLAADIAQGFLDPRVRQGERVDS